jgi:NADH-quinone oxidoreductase subunit H
MSVFAVDPLLAGEVGLKVVAIVLLKVLVVFVLLIVSVMLMIWAERKVISDMQNRIGPTRAGPWGILQTLADGLKLIFKEDLIPENSDRFVFKLAPLLTLVPAFLTFSIIPLGGNFKDDNGVVNIFGEDTFLQLADPPVGILLFLAMSSVAVYGIMLAGWSSGSKYPLLGSVRATAQMISYEAALGLTVAAVLLQSGSLSTHRIVAEQTVWEWNMWFTGFIPMAIFMVAATAELNRPPFDLVEAEQELVGGFHTEYSSIRFALFYLAEFMNTITISAIVVTLFLGGPNGPILVDAVGWLWPILWFMLKLFVLLFTFIWMRATLPRFRYDQLMDLGWKVLTPVALGWLLFLGARDVADDRGWNPILIVAIAVAGFAVFGALLIKSVRNGKALRELEEIGR